MNDAELKKLGRDIGEEIVLNDVVVHAVLTHARISGMSRDATLVYMVQELARSRANIVKEYERHMSECMVVVVPKGLEQ